MMTLEVTSEKCNSTRLPLGTTVGINKQRLLDLTSKDVHRNYLKKKSSGSLQKNFGLPEDKIVK